MSPTTTDPRERLRQVEAKIARLDRAIRGGLTCCGEIGGIRSRSTKRKNQIADRRVTACAEIVRLYPLRDNLRATVARIDRGEPEPAPSLIARVRAARKPRAVASRERLRRLPPLVTAVCNSMEEANAYMSANPGIGLIAELGGKCYLANVADLGREVTQAEFDAQITPEGIAIMEAACGGCF